MTEAGGTALRPWSKWRAPAVVAVSAVLCVVLLLTRQPARPVGRSQRWNGRHPASLPKRAGGSSGSGGSRSGSGSGGGGSGRTAATAAAASAASGKPAPLPCLFNTLLGEGDVQWSVRNGSADQLSIRGCELKRPSHQEARQCLAGKTLVFVGDSVTRYQYLTLLYFLEHGRWPAPLGGVPGDPSVANEHEWPSWNDFLRGTNALFGGRELCDCFRREQVPGQKLKEEEKHENRYYRSGEGADAISVSHFTYTTEPNLLHGHYGFPPYPKGRKPCVLATPDCDYPPDWGYDLYRALKIAMKDMRPTHLVVNSGLWGSSNAFGNDTWSKIALAGKLAVAEQDGRVFWRTTTANVGKLPVTRDHDALAIKHTVAQGWGLLDAYTITRPVLTMPKPPMWDGRHFVAVVYRELNIYLLNALCNPWV